ncbi:alpha-amylase family protein [Vibrio metschnikovii]|uniref:alpha-amylase family protein n=1 Tax=Vibrio metschnikovii TaxID=28172 RepID=UPI001C2FE448|nr:alpha-amylase family protein [Vibrio metschnikovii]MDA3139681.1 alpha-amylase family protein [Vibrio metschnikovii]
MKPSYLIAYAALISAGFTTSVQADAILHAFNWKYSDVTANAEHIAAAGYKNVLVSPAMKSSGNEWWARYQPQDLRVIDSPIGNKTDFKTMVNTLRTYGVGVYADVVLNHMANETWKRSDLNYPGSEILTNYANQASYYQQQTLFGDLTQNLFSVHDFHPEGCITDWSNPGHVQYWRLCGGPGDRGLPDLAANDWVLEQQKSYLRALKQIGISGFRIDAVKHMSQYHIDQVFTPDIIADMHVFGEVITSGGLGDATYDGFLAPYLNNTNHAAYDFPLFASIRAAFSYLGSMTLLHDPQAYGQALDNARAITFTITHDIPTNDGFRYQILDPQDEQLAYAYILGKDGGTPLIYSDALAANEDRDNGRWANVWNQPTMLKMLRFHNAMQGQSMTMIHSDPCLLVFKRGKQGVVGINKCGEAKPITIDTYQHEFNWYRAYQDVLSDDEFIVNNRYHTLSIPARSARMWMQ